jgi:site-specific recombinase XerD
VIVLFSQLKQAVLDALLVEGRAETTVATFTSVMNRFIRHTGDLNVSELTLPLAMSFLTSHKRTGICNGTLYGDVVVLRRMVRQAHACGIVDDFSHKLRFPKVEWPLPKALSAREIEHIVNYDGVANNGRVAAFLRVRNRTMLMLAAMTGARSREITGIDLQDINLVEGTVTLRKTKGNTPRQMPLHPELKAQIEAYIEARLKIINTPIKQLPALFIAYWRKAGCWKRISPASYQGIYRKHSLGQGIDSSSHTMRHTFATSLLQEGVDVSVIQQLLGHSSITMTMRYLKMDNRMKRKAVDALPFKFRGDT